MSVKLFFRHFEQTSLVCIVPLFVYIALDLYGKDEWLTIRKKIIGLFPFACWVLLIWTDPWLHVVHQSVTLVDGHLETVKSAYTVMFNLFCYVLIGGSYIFLFRFARSIQPDIRKAGVWLLILGCGPVLVEVIKTFVPGVSYWLIPISVYCGILALGLFGIVLRNKLFINVPTARSIVMETVHEGILITNMHGKATDSNRLADRLFASQWDQGVIGVRADRLMKPWPDWSAACLAMEERNLEISATVQGRPRAYIVNVYPFYSQRNRKLGAISVIVDITEKQSHIEEIARLNQFRDQLLTAISHDIRNPLAMQINLVELLVKDIREFRAEHIELIYALSEQTRLNYATVENLLEWFRNQKDEVSLHPDWLNVSEVVQEAYRMLTINMEVKQIALNIDVDETLYVYADREALVLVIRNLLSNAIKFSNRRGRVQIEANCGQGIQKMVIRDEGVGMNEEQLRKALDEWHFETTTGTEGEKGTGLGLAVSRQLLRMSGGDLTIDSLPGKGTACHVHLRMRWGHESHNHR